MLPPSFLSRSFPRSLASHSPFLFLVPAAGTGGVSRSLSARVARRVGRRSDWRRVGRRSDCDALSEQAERGGRLSLRVPVSLAVSLPYRLPVPVSPPDCLSARLSHHVQAQRRLTDPVGLHRRLGNLNSLGAAAGTRASLGVRSPRLCRCSPPSTAADQDQTGTVNVTLSRLNP
eukprot:235369-Rhodomonas_salina.1